MIFLLVRVHQIPIQKCYKASSLDSNPSLLREDPLDRYDGGGTVGTSNEVVSGCILELSLSLVSDVHLNDVPVLRIEVPMNDVDVGRHS